MVSSCWAPNCTCRATKGSKKKMYRFPLLNKALLNRWIVACNRLPPKGERSSRVDGLYKPNEHSRLCSCCHFVKGSKSADPLDVDYVPSIFAHNDPKIEDPFCVQKKQARQQSQSAGKMPREIKTPLRYQKEPEKQQTVRTGKRGRPRLARNEEKYQATPKAASEKEQVSKQSDPHPESIVIPDDDSDVEIVEVTKPPNKKKKSNNDPDWGSDKKGGTTRSRTKSKEKSAKTPTSASSTPRSDWSKKTEESRTPVTTILKKTPISQNSGIELFMECKDDPLSPAQIQSAKKEQSFYDMSQTLVKAAREGRLLFPPGGGMQILEKPYSMIFAPMTPVLMSSMPTPANIPPMLTMGDQVWFSSFLDSGQVTFYGVLPQGPLPMVNTSLFSSIDKLQITPLASPSVTTSTPQLKAGIKKKNKGGRQKKCTVRELMKKQGQRPLDNHQPFARTQGNPRLQQIEIETIAEDPRLQQIEIDTIAEDPTAPFSSIDNMRQTTPSDRESSPQQGEGIITKKKRGRPKKYMVQEPVGGTSFPQSVAGIITKRKVGRPKKGMVQEPAGGTSFPQSEAGIITKRKVGRPKKGMVGQLLNWPVQRPLERKADYMRIQQMEKETTVENATSKSTKYGLKEMMKNNQLRTMKAKMLRVTPARLYNARRLRQRIQHSERYATYLTQKLKGPDSLPVKVKEKFANIRRLLMTQSSGSSPDQFNPSDFVGRSPGNVNTNGSLTPVSAKPSPNANNQGVRPISMFPPYPIGGKSPNQAIPKSVTSVRAKAQAEALAHLRQQMQKDALAKSESEPSKKKAKKIAQIEGDETGNWVPLDEYYYGKTEGDPTYQEQKGELRFKCWYCNKMLYNNVAAMMHIQGHIDAERQVNLDLSDLTQCKHCYKQFDTPFEMQTHIEKVHMNNASVLLCRICEKDHDSRHALTDHMKRNHNACEMPYICQLCKFRSSMYSDVVDHFKKKHNSSESMLCLYCLRVYQIRFVSQGWGQTSIYYNHLMKHQIKNCCKKCTHCKLIFLNSVDLKAHRKTDHLPNQKGVIGINAKYTTPHQVMIKVMEKAEPPGGGGGIKSLNVPAVKKILEHKLSFPSNVYKVKCIECKMLMGIPDHYKKFIQCSMCRFATSCSFAYANHMMGFHSGQLTAAASHTPTEAKLEDTLYCTCGFQSSFGNRIANHLVGCSKISCSKDQPPPFQSGEYGQKLQDPRKKPDASLLDILGLVKKDSLPTTSTRLRYDSPPPEPVDMPEVSALDVLPRRPSLLKDAKKKAAETFVKEEDTQSKAKVSIGNTTMESSETYTESPKAKLSSEDGVPESADSLIASEEKSDESGGLDAETEGPEETDKDSREEEIGSELDMDHIEKVDKITDVAPELCETKENVESERQESNCENIPESATKSAEDETNENVADGLVDLNQAKSVEGRDSEDPIEDVVRKEDDDPPSSSMEDASSSKLMSEVLPGEADEITVDTGVKDSDAVKACDEASTQQMLSQEDGGVFARGLKSDSRAGLVLAPAFNDADSRVIEDKNVFNDDSRSSDFKSFFSEEEAQEDKASVEEEDVQSGVIFDLEEESSSSKPFLALSGDLGRTNQPPGIFTLEEGSSDARDWSVQPGSAMLLVPDNSNLNLVGIIDHEHESSAMDLESPGESFSLPETAKKSKAEDACDDGQNMASSLSSASLDDLDLSTTPKATPNGADIISTVMEASPVQPENQNRLIAEEEELDLAQSELSNSEVHRALPESVPCVSDIQESPKTVLADPLESSPMEPCDSYIAGVTSEMDISSSGMSLTSQQTEVDIPGSWVTADPNSHTVPVQSEAEPLSGPLGLESFQTEQPDSSFKPETDTNEMLANRPVAMEDEQGGLDRASVSASSSSLTSEAPGVQESRLATSSNQDRESSHRNRSRSRSRSLDYHRDRRSRSRDADRHRYRDSYRDGDRDRYDRDRDHYRDRSRDRDRHRNRSRDRDSGRSQDSRDYGRSSRDSRDYGRSRDRDRSRERDRSRDRDRSKERDYRKHYDDRRYR